MPTDQGLEDRRQVVAEFDSALYPSGEPTAEEAWLGIYQVLMWYEHGLMHIKESNDLKKSKTWQSRAKLAERFVADHLSVAPNKMPSLVDRMMCLDRWKGMQRNNPLGHGLRMLVSEILNRWASPRFTYYEESLATKWFPGIQMPGRSTTPYIDVLAANGLPRAVISCKWSYRHDRISDVTNECQEYKAAAVRRQIPNFGYYLVANDFDARRIEKVISQPCVDALVHVHLLLLRHISDDKDKGILDAAVAQGRLLDLTSFLALTQDW